MSKKRLTKLPVLKYRLSIFLSFFLLIFSAVIVFSFEQNYGFGDILRKFNNKNSGFADLLAKFGNENPGSSQNLTSNQTALHNSYSDILDKDSPNSNSALKDSVSIAYPTPKNSSPLYLSFVKPAEESELSSSSPVIDSININFKGWSDVFHAWYWMVYINASDSDCDLKKLEWSNPDYFSGGTAGPVDPPGRCSLNGGWAAHDDDLCLTVEAKATDFADNITTKSKTQCEATPTTHSSSPTPTNRPTATPSPTPTTGVLSQECPITLAGSCSGSNLCKISDCYGQEWPVGDVNSCSSVNASNNGTNSGMCAINLFDLTMCGANFAGCDDSGSHNCPAGYTCQYACSDAQGKRVGDCVPVSQPQASCTDTDSGYDVYNKGTVSGINGQGTPFSYTDRCSTGPDLTLWLEENMCWGVGGCIVDDPLVPCIVKDRCPSGYACLDGACISITPKPTNISVNPPVPISCGDTLVKQVDRCEKLPQYAGYTSACVPVPSICPDGTNVQLSYACVEDVNHQVCTVSLFGGVWCRDQYWCSSSSGNTPTSTFIPIPPVSVTPTTIPTSTPLPTITPIPTPTPTSVPTPTATPSPQPTPTFIPTATPTRTPIPTTRPITTPTKAPSLTPIFAETECELRDHFCEIYVDCPGDTNDTLGCQERYGSAWTCCIVTDTRY